MTYTIRYLNRSHAEDLGDPVLATIEAASAAEACDKAYGQGIGNGWQLWAIPDVDARALQDEAGAAMAGELWDGMA